MPAAVIAEIDHLGRALGQRSCLVKDHCVDLRQTFQRGSVFDQ